VKAEGATTIEHHKYKMGLYEELKNINKLILEEQAVQDSMDPTFGQPFEHVTQVWPV
jgi:hypothetical protein